MRRTIIALTLISGCAHTPSLTEAIDGAQVATLTIGAVAHGLEPKDAEAQAKVDALRATVSEIEALLADLDKLAPEIDAIVEARKTKRPTE